MFAKFLKLSIVLICILILNNSNAQIIISNADMPSANDTIRISKASPLIGVNIDSTGADYLWDFSSLVSESQELDTFLSVTNTSLVYFAVFYNASIAGKLPAFSIPIPSQPLNFSNGYTFFKKTNSVYSQLGFSSELNGVPLPIKFDNEDVQYKFPLEYGDTDSCTFKYNVQIPNLGYFEETKKRKNIVDGWGTLKTPYGTFEVLRVVSYLKIKDSIHYDAYNFGLAINRTETEYKWLGKSKDIPLLKITKNNFVISEITYIDSARISTNIDNTVNAEDFFIYPNPTSDYIVVNSNNDNVLKVEVIDAMGKSMIVKEIRNNNFIDIQSLKCGLYFVMIYDENTNLLSRKKIIIKR